MVSNYPARLLSLFYGDTITVFYNQCAESLHTGLHHLHGGVVLLGHAVLVHPQLLPVRDDLRTPPPPVQLHEDAQVQDVVVQRLAVPKLVAQPRQLVRDSVRHVSRPEKLVSFRFDSLIKI